MNTMPMNVFHHVAAMPRVGRSATGGVAVASGSGRAEVDMRPP